jgi:hypothetical protein
MSAGVKEKSYTPCLKPCMAALQGVQDFSLVPRFEMTGFYV